MYLLSILPVPMSGVRWSGTVVTAHGTARAMDLDFPIPAKC